MADDFDVARMSALNLNATGTPPAGFLMAHASTLVTPGLGPHKYRSVSYFHKQRKDMLIRDAIMPMQAKIKHLLDALARQASTIESARARSDALTLAATDALQLVKAAKEEAQAARESHTAVMALLGEIKAGVAEGSSRSSG